MANTEGMKHKFIVLKQDDVNRLHPFDQNKLQEVCEEISEIRKMDKKPSNTYLVINTDETYADEVIEILKRHGHWG